MSISVRVGEPVPLLRVSLGKISQPVTVRIDALAMNQAIQQDVIARQEDVTERQNVVAGIQTDIQTRQADITQKHTEVESDRTEVASHRQDVIDRQDDVIARQQAVDSAAAQHISDLQTESNTQVARVQSEGDTQDARVQSEGDTQVARVQSEGDTQVGAATTQASNAANSATLAGQHKDTAVSEAVAAANSATLAEQHKDTAVSEASAAANSATLAGQHKDTAVSEASDAANSATLAGQHRDAINPDNFYLKTEVDQQLNDLDALPDQTGQADKALFTDGTNAAWQYIPEGLPEQTGNAGKALFSDGTNASWGVVDGGGRKNLLINGNKWINQRGFVGDWSALSVGAYGYDRWKKHASGIEQIIEGGWFGAGDYVLHWVGSGSGFVNGVAVANGGSVTVDGVSNVSVVVPEDATFIQFERDRRTDYEVVDQGTEFIRCVRYFYKIYGNASHFAARLTGNLVVTTIHLPAPMRTTPSILLPPIYVLGGGGSTTNISLSSYLYHPNNIHIDMRLAINSFTPNSERVYYWRHQSDDSTTYFDAEL